MILRCLSMFFTNIFIQQGQCPCNKLTVFHAVECRIIHITQLNYGICKMLCIPRTGYILSDIIRFIYSLHPIYIGHNSNFTFPKIIGKFSLLKFSVNYGKLLTKQYNSLVTISVFKMIE